MRWLDHREPVPDALRGAILDKVPIRKLQQIARSRGMCSLWEAGLRRVLDGETTLEEILRVVPADEE